MFIFVQKPVTMYVEVLYEEIFSEKFYIAQPKYDGHRTIIVINNDYSINLFSRTGRELDVDPEFRNNIKVAMKAAKIPPNSSLDSELMGKREAYRNQELIIYDALYWDGEQICSSVPYWQRMLKLHELPEHGIIRLIENITGPWPAQFKDLMDNPALEGMVFKLRDYIYIPSNRNVQTPSMVKIKWRDGHAGNTPIVAVEDNVLVSC